MSLLKVQAVQELWRSERSLWCKLDSFLQWRRKDFLIGGTQFESTHTIGSNLYNNLWKLGGAHAPGAPPGSYAYVLLPWCFTCGSCSLFIAQDMHMHTCNINKHWWIMLLLSENVETSGVWLGLGDWGSSRDLHAKDILYFFEYTSPCNSHRPWIVAAQSEALNEINTALG